MTAVAIVLGIAMIGFAVWALWRGGGRVGPGSFGYDPAADPRGHDHHGWSHDGGGHGGGHDSGGHGGAGH